MENFNNSMAFEQYLELECKNNILKNIERALAKIKNSEANRLVQFKVLVEQPLSI